MEWLSKLASYNLPWPAAAVIVLATVLCTKGVTALMKIRKGKYDDRQQSHARELDLIGVLTSRLQIVEGRLDAEHADRIECTKSLGILQGRFDQIKEDMDATVDAAITRHDARNKQHTEQLKRLVAEKEAALAIQALEIAKQAPP